MFSGVASYWALGHMPLLKFWKFCAFYSCCQLSCKNFENYRRETCITFSPISPETRYNLRKQIKKVSEPKRNPGQRRRWKIHFVLPLPSFPGDATEYVCCETNVCRL